MDEELKRQFSGKPSVAKMEKYISTVTVSPSERVDYYYSYYRSMFTEWNEMNRTYQNFSVLLVNHNRELFARFLNENTVLGKLKYEPYDTELHYKVMELLEVKAASKQPNRNHLVFSMQLGFRFDKEKDVNINTIEKWMRRNKINTDDILYLSSKADIANIDDEHLDLL